MDRYFRLDTDQHVDRQTFEFRQTKLTWDLALLSVTECSLQLGLNATFYVAIVLYLFTPLFVNVFLESYTHSPAYAGGLF